MKFYVIYSFDCGAEESVKAFQPPKLHQWKLTECRNTIDEADFEGLPKHRKYAAMLNKQNFEDFIDALGLYAEEFETMGSLTALGLLPAISFDRDMEYDYAVYQCAYVTPFPEGISRELEEKDWQRIRKAIIQKYG